MIPAQLTERRELSRGMVLLWLYAPALTSAARPGQFVMLHPAAGLDPFFGRPMWIHRQRDTDRGEEFAVLLEVVGPGSASLAGLSVGQQIGVRGPLGTAIRYAPGARNLLLVAEGRQIAPLVWVADEETVRGRAVTLLLGGSTAADLYPLELIRPEVEVVVLTADGSAGERGSVAERVAEYAGWCDQLIASLPVPAYTDLRYALRGLPYRRPCLALLERSVPCGIGWCRSCTVSTRRDGTRLLCVDGPAFDLRSVT